MLGGVRVCVYVGIYAGVCEYVYVGIGRCRCRHVCVRECAYDVCEVPSLPSSTHRSFVCVKLHSEGC
jgi:hypothetical protein